MRKYRIFSHTADVGIEVYGKDEKELFENAAKGMFSVMVDLKGVRRREERRIEVEAEDKDALLVSFLNELLYLVDTEGILFRDFNIEEIKGGKLTGRAYGERIDPSRHRLKTQVKAATYHLLKIEKEDGLKARIILDI